MKKRVILIVLSIFILTLAYSVSADDWGCCVDEISGCYNVFTESDIENCEENNDFELNTSCYSIPSDTSIPVTSNPICQQTGCCCFDDGTYSGDVIARMCDSLGGDFTSSDDCSVVCGGGSDLDLTCNDLNGYWCLPADADSDASELKEVTDFTGQFSSSHICYDMPCAGGDCDKGDFGYEKYCANGKNDDGDCLIDTLDTDCQNAVQGFIVDENSKGVSNVKVKIENIDNNEIFHTYSVGYEGEYYFQGLSYGRYILDLDTTYYEDIESPSGFSISKMNTFEKNKNFVVIPNNARNIEGLVRDKNNNPIEGALVVIDNSDYYATTDSNGRYLIEYVRAGDIYSIVAYKSGYFPSEKTQFRLDEGEDSRNINLYLQNEGCDVSAPIPMLTEASVGQGKLEVKLEYEETGCDPVAVTVERCDKELFPSCDEANFNSISTGPFSGEVIDADVEWNSNYVYRIKAQYENGRISEASTSIEIFTGNEECANRPIGNEFCIYEFEQIDGFKEVTSSTGYYCNAENLLSVVRTCNEGTKCVEYDADEGSTKTVCRNVQDCNPGGDNLLGLFFDEDTCEGTNNQNFCVYDYSRTNVNYCFSCSQYASCFDYRSENTCGEDICGIGGCNWTYTDATLNQGVCYSEDKSSCEDCNNPFNKVFGMCTANICNNLGSCSFSTISNRCEDCGDISCYEYSSVDYCGSASSIQLNTFDNTLISTSDDVCEQGTCLWNSVSQECYKDANADGIDDCSDISAGLSSSPVYTEEDCKIDTIKPQTSVTFNRKYFNPNKGSNLKINFNSADRVPGSDNVYEVKSTYFCIEGEGTSNCKSTKSTYNTVPLVGINYTLTLDAVKGTFGGGTNNYRIRPGKNTIKFYARDFSDNLEVVKEDFFYLDTEAPDVDISFVSNANSEARTTDVYVIGNANEDVYCYAEMSDCEEWDSCDDNAFDNVTAEFIKLKEDEFNSHFSTSLNGLPDGNSDLIIKCTDYAGNIFEETRSLILDSDSRIVEGLPSNVTDSNNVELSVKTSANVECRYSENLDDSFSSMTPMTSSNQGSFWKHAEPLTLNEDRNYVYYVRCNYNPVALQKISFTIDTVKPNVAGLDGGEYEISDVWYDDIDLGIVCEDSPLYGFGCNKTTYCLEPLYDFSGEIGSCTPNTNYTGLIDINFPVSVCYYAQENTYRGMGGQYSDTVCRNILVDNTDPQLSVYGLPDTVNVNSLKVNGAVFDSVEQGSLSFSDVTSDYDSIFELFSDVKYYGAFSHENFQQPFDYSLAIDFSSLSVDDEGEIKIWLEDGSDYVALVFDLEDNKIKLGKKGIFGFSTMDETVVSPDYFSGRKNVRISKNANIFSAEVQSIDTSETYALSGMDSLMPTKAGVILKGEEIHTKLKNAFSNVFMLTSSVTSFPTDVFLKINSALKEVQSVDGDFTFETKFTESTPYHGAQYEVLIYAKDISGRQSEFISKTVIYDLSGPEVYEVNYEFEDQDDADYIEYGSDSKLIVRIEDDYSQTQSASVEFDGVTRILNYNSKNGLWEADIDTTELAIGTYDLKFEMYDKLGNLNVQTLNGEMNVEDRIDPAIIITIPNPNTNDPKPKIDAETDVLAICDMEYDVQGQTYFASGTNTFTNNHVFSITQALDYVVGEETPHNVIIDCKSEDGDRVRQKFKIYEDFRNPIYSIRTQDIVSYASKVKRHSIKYNGFVPQEYGLFFLADEPVKCKYSLGSEPRGSYSALSNSFEKTSVGLYSQGDFSDLYFFTDKSSENFEVICIDRAGNSGATKNVEISVNSDDKPHFFNFPEVMKNTGLLEFNSVRPLSCTYSFAGGTGSITRSKVNEDYYSQMLDLGLSDFSDGEYDLRVSCTDGTRSSSKSIKVYKDNSAPNIVKDIPETVNSNEANIEIFLDENAEIRIYINGMLGAITKGDSFTETVILDSGYNEVIVEAEDVAGNIASSTSYVISESDFPKAYISNHIASSTQDKFVGQIIVNDLPKLIVNGQLEPVLSLEKSENGYNYYSFEVSRNDLKSVIGDFEYLNETSEIPVTFSVEVDGEIIHEEVMLYHYFAESVLFSSPIYEIIVNEDLVNHNRLEISGRVNNENYLSSSYYSLGNDFEINLGKFNFTNVIDNAGEVYFTFVNDLGVETVVSLKYILERTGPTPVISIYPEGERATTPNPKFLVIFRNLATISDAKIWDERLENSYEVSGYGVVGWRNVLTTVEKLPSEGQYYLNIMAKDKNGVEGEAQFNFIYEKIDFDIDLVSPEAGVSPTNTYDAVFETPLDALCRYSVDSTDYGSMIEMTSEPSMVHTINLTGSKTVNIKCQVNGEINSRVDTFVFSVDTSIPKIRDVEIINAKRISGDEYITNYPLKANLLVETDDASYCRYSVGRLGSSLKTEFNSMSDVGLSQCSSLMKGDFCYSTSSNVVIPDLDDGQSYEANIVCQNKAGLVSAIEEIEFKVDLSKNDAITIAYPRDYLNDNSVFVQAETENEIDCKFGFEENEIAHEFPHSNGKIHNATVTLTQTGSHTLYVECLINGNITQKTKSFVIDKTSPLVGKVLVANETNSLNFLQALVQDFEDNESGIRVYEYAIGVSPAMRNGWNSERNWTAISGSTINARGLNLEEGETYYFSVRAMNKALLYSSVVSSDGIIINTNGSDDGLISNESNIDNTCDDGVKNGDETGVDCGEACLRPCPEGTFCENDSDCYSSEMQCLDFECVYVDSGAGSDDNGGIEVNDSGHVPYNPSSTSGDTDWWIWLLLILGLLAILGAGGYYAYERYGPFDWKFIKKKNGTGSSPQNTFGINQNATSANGAMANATINNTSDTNSNKPKNRIPNQALSTEKPNINNAELLKQRKERLKKALRRKLVDEQKESSVEERDKLFEKFESKDDNLEKKVSALKKASKNKSHAEVKELHKDVVGSSDTKKMLKEAKK